MREYYPRAFGTWAIFPQLREISLTIDLDASHYLHSTNKAHRNNIVHVKLKPKKLNRGSNCKGLHVRLNTVNVCVIVCLRNALTQWWYIRYTFQ